MRHVVTLDLLMNSAFRKEVGESLPGEEEEGKEGHETAKYVGV